MQLIFLLHAGSHLTVTTLPHNSKENNTALSTLIGTSENGILPNKINTSEQRMTALPMFLLHESGLHVAVVAQLSVLDEVILRSPKRSKKSSRNLCQ
jgi:hypothetical protein